MAARLKVNSPSRFIEPIRQSFEVELFRVGKLTGTQKIQGRNVYFGEVIRRSFADPSQTRECRFRDR